MQTKIVTKSEAGTLKLGNLLGRNLKIGDVIALKGELGSGKTVLVKGIAKGLGIKNAEYLVSSPSFVLIKEYPGLVALFHFDLYRLDNQILIEELGWEEYLDKKGVLVIEWADKLKGLLPENHLSLTLEVISEKERKIIIVSQAERYKKLIREIKINK